MSSPRLHGKYSNYHYCIVRECKNTSVKTPGKLWIRMPSKTNMRNTWLKLAKKDPDSLSLETKIYFCEDHFDLENDMANYMQYKIMGSVKRIKMKPNCIPSRFDCRSDRKHKLTPTPDEFQHNPKITTVMTLSEDIKPIYSIEMSTSSFQQELLSKECAIPSSTSTKKELHDKAEGLQHNKHICDQAIEVQPIQEHVSCQLEQHHHHKTIQSYVPKHKTHRRKQLQFSETVKNAISSSKQVIIQKSISTCIAPSLFGTSTRKQIFTEENYYDSDVLYKISQASSFDSSPYKSPSQNY